MTDLLTPQALDPRRWATASQRTIVLRRQTVDGVARCAACGVDFRGCCCEFDHIIPWILGGLTVVENLQALCSACNKRKGFDTADCPLDLTADHHVVGDWPETLRPRAWAARFMQDYFTQDKANYLLVATPGAGKTLASFKAVHERFLRGDIDRVVFVSPTDVVRNGYYELGPLVGVQLAPGFIGPIIPRFYHGLSVTYQGVLENAAELALLCENERVMLVLDEVHHASEEKAWGQALAEARPVYTLSMSGTPFRTDGNRIAGVSLVRDPDDETRFVSFNDFTYSYLEGLSDQTVVREVFFPSVDGEMRWISRYVPDEVQVASFSDDLKPGEAQQRLRTFLWAVDDETAVNGLRAMLSAAHAQLQTLQREGDPRAQALVAVIDEAHAEQVKALLLAITGEEPLKVTYDDANASDKLKAFRNSDTSWLVAIKMASEGYDNRRLRVGVYASAYTTPLFLQQFVGRFQRFNPALDVPMLSQPAFVYIPNDERLVALARAIYDEVEEFEYIRTTQTAPGPVAAPGVPRRPSVPNPAHAFHPLSATGQIVAVHGPVTVEELIERQRMMDNPPKPDYLRHAEQRALLKRLIREAGPDSDAVREWGVAA